MKSYQHHCGRENDLTPDPNGLTIEFKSCKMHSEERKRMVKVSWQKCIREWRTGGNSEVRSCRHRQLIQMDLWQNSNVTR
jgi:hypothetical protein